MQWLETIIVNQTNAHLLAKVDNALDKSFFKKTPRIG
jgi:hypothetical protein